MKKKFTKNCGYRINFGIKSSTVQQFIKANNVNSASPNLRKISTKDLGLKVQKATVYLDCWMTESHYHATKASKTSLFKNVKFD
jgi:hypothetical protein